MSGAFEAIYSVLTGTVKAICDAISQFYTNVLQPIFDQLKHVTGVFSQIKNVVDKVEDAISPIKWALDAVECIFKKIVQPVINFIMDVSCFSKK